jgi:hypothetical protein
MGEIVKGRDGKLYELDRISGDVSELTSDNRFLVPETNKFCISKANVLFKNLRNGKSMQESCEKANMDFGQLHNWRRLFPEFANRLDEAIEDRAFFYEDMIHQLAMDSDLPAVEINAKIAALEKLAKMGNTKRYNNKKQDQESGGVTFVINTGVPNPDPVNLEDIIYVERNYASKGAKGSGVDLQGRGSGGGDSEAAWWDSREDQAHFTDEGFQDTTPAEGPGDDEPGTDKGAEQDLFGGVGSIFTGRGGRDE